MCVQYPCTESCKKLARDNALQCIPILEKNIKRLKNTIKEGAFQSEYIDNCRRNLKRYTENLIEAKRDASN